MFNPFEKFCRAIIYVGRHGPTRFARELCFRISNWYHDWHLGIKSSGFISLSDLGIEKSDSVDCEPSPYDAIYGALRKLSWESRSVFLDYGCGKGRAVVVAATYPFERVIGVDLSESLIEIARVNVHRMKFRRAKQVDLYHGDASTYQIPPDVNVIFFFNPFRGETLRQVVADIRASFEKSPRKITVIFLMSEAFDKIVGDQDWIAKVYQSRTYPDCQWSVYETAMRGKHPGGVSTPA